MSERILTTQDLIEFKVELINELRRLFREFREHQPKKWLKSNEVRKLLNISPSTLQNLRINGTLPYTRIGSIIFYSLDDINRIIDNNKSHPPFLKS
jgi:hypothetical protein